MTTDESTLYFVANLILFALLLLYWAHLLRPKWVTDRMSLGALLLFLSCQGMALLWSGLRLGPWVFAHRYLSAMFLIEAIVLVYLLLERLLGQRGQGAFVLTLAFVIHTYVILLISPPIEPTLQISPFVRNPWHLLHLLSAVVAYGAYTCAGAGAIGYFVARFLTRSRLAPRLPSRQDCQVFTRRALVLGFPWLSGSLVTGAIWAQLAWGSYWSWRPDEVWLLVVWLILAMTLHARTMPGWQGRPLVLLALLGFTLALLSLAFLGQGLAPVQ
jgi:ABC-type transport system involved in cytochrome c biogenesis permease subunit